MPKSEKVLLLKPLQGQGNAWDIISVKSHFANHVLIPKGVAVYYDKQTKNQHEAHQKRIDKFNKQFKKSMHEIAEKLKKDWVTFVKNATEEGGLYDSISSKTLAYHIKETENLTVPAEYFILDPKIEALGEFTALLQFDDIDIEFPIIVERKVDEDE